MTSRRKSVCLTIAEKYDVLEMRKKSESQQSAMEKYGISRIALLRIYAQSEKITKQFESSTELERGKRRLTQRTVNVDRVVYQWYLRCKERNVEMTGAELQKRAREINGKLYGPTRFTASSTWLLRFKQRYNITNADIREYVRPKIEIVAAEVFTYDLGRVMWERQITLGNIYNVVYTTIMWKILPEGTRIMERAKSSGNLDIFEDYVTALFCVNTTGCCKLPILIIGTDPGIRVIYNYDTDSVSTIYKSKANACMDSAIFKEWYEDVFLKEVKERQRENARMEQYMLVLDNAMSLHNLNDLNDLYPFVIVKSIPVNVSPLRQPMNCGIIACFKRKYRLELLKTTIRSIVRATEQDMMDINKEISMWEYCRIVDKAWSSVDDETVIDSWDCLLKVRDMASMKYTKEWDNDTQEALKIMKQLPGCEECEDIDVHHWFFIENQYDIVKKKCLDEVVREFKGNPPVNVDIVADEAGPSCAKFSKRS